MNDTNVAQIRTTTPAVVGAILTYLAAKYDIVIDADASAGLIIGFAALATSAYYRVVRALEAKWPVVGWLLGNPKTPTYSGNVDA